MLSRRTIDILKIDVEGYEWRVLQGARQMFATAPPRFVFIEYSNWNLIHVGQMERPEDLLDFLAQVGYKLWWINTPKKGLTGSEVTPELFQSVIINHEVSKGRYADLVLRLDDTEPE